MFKLNQLAMQTSLNYNITNGLRSRDVTSSSDSAVRLGLSVYGTNSLSNCRRCNMAFARVAVSFKRPLTVYVCRLLWFVSFIFNNWPSRQPTRPSRSISEVWTYVKLEKFTHTFCLISSFLLQLSSLSPEDRAILIASHAGTVVPESFKEDTQQKLRPKFALSTLL